MSKGSDDRWRQVSALLDKALAVEPAKRRAWLDRRVAEPGLRAEVDALLALAESPDGILEQPAADHLDVLIREEGDAEAADRGLLAGTRLGPYRLLREVGSGGMGVVYLAERADGQFEKQVALKLVRSGLGGEEVMRRFGRERRIAARLEHPRIAQIFDGGLARDGRPYFAMEFVDGEPIDTFCDGHGLSIEERLTLFVDACEAVEYAHRRLVVHRDLKPSNVLVTSDRTVKLVDFGIAKMLSEDDPEGGDLTKLDGRRPLTLAYAAPEQLAGHLVTTATDVYSLGVLLYELLSGQRPFAGSGDNDRALERAILEGEPRAPSRAARRAESAARRAADRGLSPAALGRRLAGELDAIVLRALDSEPARRYPSVESLREDVVSHLEHRPVRARRAGGWGRAAKFVRRHRFGVAAAALLALSVIAGLGGTLWQARQKAGQAARAERMTGFVLGLFEAADPAQARGQEITARELVEQGVDRLEWELAGDPGAQAEMGLVLGRIHDRLGHSEDALRLLDQSLARSSAVAGPDAQRTRAGALRAKGAALVRLGRSEEAEPLLREAIAAHRRLGALGAERALEVAEDLDELSIALRALGRLDESETAVREGFALRASRLAPDHPDLATSYNNLAVIERELGRFDEAEANYRRALEIRVPAMGRDHPETVNTANNLAALLFHRGRYAAAAAAFRDVVASYERIYGDRHPRTVTGLNNLASVLLRLGDLDPAEDLFGSVLDFWRETANERHPNALMTASNLGLLYQLRGEPRSAAERAGFAVDGAAEVLGAEHPVTAIFRVRLATAWRELGRYAEAGEQAAAALAVLDGVYGAGHQYVAAALEESGRIALATGRPERAEEDLRRALSIRDEQLGPDSFEALALRAAVAAALTRRGAVEEAEALLGEALPVARDGLPPDHPILLGLLLETARARAAAGEIEEAEDLFAETARRTAGRYGADSWKTAEVDLRRSEALAAVGRGPAARDLAASARGRLERALGADHPLTRAASELAAG